MGVNALQITRILWSIPPEAHDVGQSIQNADFPGLEYTFLQINPGSFFM